MSCEKSEQICSAVSDLCEQCGKEITLVQSLQACAECSTALLKELSENKTCHKCVFSSECRELKCVHDTCEDNDLFQHGNNNMSCVHLCDNEECCDTGFENVFAKRQGGEGGAADGEAKGEPEKEASFSDEDSDESFASDGELLEDSDWVPKPPKEYYGVIPEGTTSDQLAAILAQGIIKYAQEACVNGVKVGGADIYGVLDGWFEKDCEGADEFDHLVDEDDYDEFEQKVIELISEECEL